MPEPFRTTRLVEFHDTDMAGIMHFASFFVYMESAEHELLRTLGFSVHSRMTAGAHGGEVISFPRVAASCTYQAPAKCEEILDIAISVSRIGEKSITYQFRITTEGRPIALGTMTSVCCRLTPDGPPKSRPIPVEFVEKLQRYAEPPARAGG